jgi:predicted metalloprotease with PDZ domain
MLVAFIYDLSLRRLTNCNSSLEDVYAELFSLPAGGQRRANQTIIRVLTEREGLKSSTRDYVETAATINLEPALSSYGIVLQQGGSQRPQRN